MSCCLDNRHEVRPRQQLSQRVHTPEEQTQKVAGQSPSYIILIRAHEYHLLLWVPDGCNLQASLVTV